MCYHVSETSDPHDLAAKLKKRVNVRKKEFVHKPRYHVNGFEKPLVPVIPVADPETLRFFRWGLIPEWVSDPKTFKANTLNAKSEEIWDKPSYRNYWQNRCLVVVDGFFEPHVIDPKKPSQSYYMKSPDNEPLTLAGIYSVFEGKGTFTILTCDANDQMAEIHNEGERMPVIIDDVDREEWIRADLTQERMKELCAPYPWELTAYRTIDGVFNSRVMSDVPEAIMPLEFL